MTNMLQANYKFHPVGQGSFYTGKINKHSSKYEQFSMVYDCGTSSEQYKLKDCIASFRDHLYTKALDVLFLSHLDNDHVNGVKMLLSGIRCKKIYLPYLTPIERLTVAIRYKSEDFTDSPEDFNFLTFLQNPTEYLLTINNFDINEIIYIFGNAEDEILSERDSDNTNTIGATAFEVLESRLVDIAEKDLSEEMILIKKSSEKIQFKKGNNKLLLKNVWEFFVYFMKGSDDSKILIKIKEAIKTIYELPIDKELDQTNLQTILYDQEKLKELRKSLRKILKSLNKTGLVVQHKPLGNREATFRKEHETDRNNLNHRFNSWYKRFQRNSFSNLSSPKGEWGVSLLTGDTSLNQIEDSGYIKNHLPQVLVFQVPHHGSDTEWENRYLSNLNNKGMTSAVINFGYGNSYGHPKPDVLTDLDNLNFDICFCNQFEDFSYCFWFKV